MTIEKVLNWLDDAQPNQISREEKIGWLSSLDSEIWEKVIRTHEGWEDIRKPHYDEGTDEGTELIVPEPFDRLYKNWMAAQLDYAYEEVGRYNNHISTFNKEFQEYANWYNRGHMAIGCRGVYF